MYGKDRQLIEMFFNVFFFKKRTRMYGSCSCSSFLSSVLCYAVWRGTERLLSFDSKEDFNLPAAS